MKLTRWMQLGTPSKWFPAIAMSMALVACGGGDDDPPRTTVQATSTMSGDQEAPPVTSGATGSGTLTLDPSNVATGSITLDGMTATAAHIHRGAVGVDGPVIVTLARTATDTWTVPSGTVFTEEQRAAMLAGELYFNAHNAANPDGEIRGQIGRDVFNVTLSPAQEVPPVASAASGTGRLTLDPATRSFTATLTVSGMVASAAHIHAAAAGAEGAVVFPLAETAPGSGVWMTAAGATLTEAQAAQLRAGELYFNAHSATYPDGEVRGQIGRLVGFASLTGAQEVPPTPSTATGTGTLVIDPFTRAATGSIRITGMEAENAHIHLGAPGVPGAIIVVLTNTAPGVWSVPANTRLTATQVAAFLRGELYYNAHSALFRTGEIRGQIR